MPRPVRPIPPRFAAAAALLALAVGVTGCDREAAPAAATDAGGAPTYVPGGALVVTAAGTATARAGAPVAGRVRLDGPVPTMKPIDVTGVADCARRHGRPPREESVVATAEGHLKNAVVYVSAGLDAAARGPAPAGAPAAVLDQVGCVYVPHIVALRTGQRLTIKNTDATVHNAHATPSANPAFNAQFTTGDSTRTLTFATPEIFRVKCDVHPWMQSFTAVFDHGFFAVTDEAGRFELPGLPAGQYTLTCWQERLGRIEQKLEVTAAGGASPEGGLMFTYKAPE